MGVSVPQLDTYTLTCPQGCCTKLITGIPGVQKYWCYRWGPWWVVVHGDGSEPEVRIKKAYRSDVGK